MSQPVRDSSKAPASSPIQQPLVASPITSLASRVMSNHPSINLICSQCPKVGKKRCGGCKTIFYCSEKCQKTAWKTHKKVCKQLRKEYIEEASKPLIRSQKLMKLAKKGDLLNIIHFLSHKTYIPLDLTLKDDKGRNLLHLIASNILSNPQNIKLLSITPGVPLSFLGTFFKLMSEESPTFLSLREDKDNKGRTPYNLFTKQYRKIEKNNPSLATNPSWKALKDLFTPTIMVAFQKRSDGDYIKLTCAGPCTDCDFNFVTKLPDLSPCSDSCHCDIMGHKHKPEVKATLSE